MYSHNIVSYVFITVMISLLHMAYLWYSQYFHILVIQHTATTLSSTLDSFLATTTTRATRTRASHICVPCRSAYDRDQNVWFAKFQLDRVIYVKVPSWSLDSEITAVDFLTYICNFKYKSNSNYVWSNYWKFQFSGWENESVDRSTRIFFWAHFQLRIFLQ